MQRLERCILTRPIAHSQNMYNSLDSLVGYSSDRIVSYQALPQISYVISSNEELRNRLYVSSDHKKYSAQSSYDIFVHQEDSVESFLNPLRPSTPFIGAIDEISEYIVQCFTAVTGDSFPHDVSLRLCSTEELKNIHQELSGSWSHGIMGFSLNNPRGMSEIFVKQDSFDRVMITIGHEIGHVISPTLPDKVMEEAKAFAFEMAWITALREHNIAGLGSCVIDTLPASNGIHDKAFWMVLENIKHGLGGLELFKKIVRLEEIVSMN